MKTWLNCLCLIAALSVFCPRVVCSQAKTEPPQKAASVAIPHEDSLRFLGPAMEDDKTRQMLNELLSDVKPAEIAAAVFGVPVEKIELVPHIYWREAKWVDWAEKADQAPGATAKFGPDDKIVMSAAVEPFGTLHLEIGPVPQKNQAEIDKYGHAVSQILERVAAKMVRQAPEFSVNVVRHKRFEDFNKIEQRLRDLNEQIEKIRREIGGEVGLSPVQLAERYADLARQALSTRMSLDVMKARESAIRHQIESLKAQADAKVADNQTLRTLKRIVELRKSRFENLKKLKAQGTVPQDDVDKVEEEMLAAMVELDRASATQQKDESQAQLDQLTAELSKLAVDRAEADARLKFLADAVPDTEQQLAKRRDMDAKSDEFRSRLTALERRRSELQEQRNQAEDVLNSPIEPFQLTIQ